jgi:hypothetical protein
MPPSIDEYLYSYYSTIKKLTCQENCEPVIKKVIKRLNCNILNPVFDGDIVD